MRLQIGLMRVKMIKKLIKNYVNMGGYRVIYKMYNFLNPHNHIRIPKGNQFVCSGALLHNVDISISGTGNAITLHEKVNLTNCRIKIYGNNNVIQIGASTSCNQTTFWIEDTGNCIVVGEKCGLTGVTELAAIEGTTITIGDNCLFSNHITFRTGDSHSIISLDGKRCNPSEDILIHDHVWIGADVVCLKGTEIADGCIVGTRSLVTKKFVEPNCVIAGSPAKVVKKEITWMGERIPVQK